MQSNEPIYTAPPFPAFPCTSRYIPLGSVEEAVTRVCRSVHARETISLVIGPPGTGKSLICRLLAERFRHDFDVVLLGETSIETRHELLMHLVHQLRLDAPLAKDPQLTLVDYLDSDQSAPAGLLILVDEAQSLPPAVIEALRMVTNILRDGEPCVITVLCGGMKLDETLVDASLDAFTQRIATRCYLHPMNADETRQYICDTIESCGWEPAETITGEAIAAVHHACSGIPRLINQMLTLAIDCAAETNEVIISEAIIDRAWVQLQQLPSPIVDEPRIAGHAAPIEFGDLDDSVIDAPSLDFNTIETIHAEQEAASMSCCGGCDERCDRNEKVTVPAQDQLKLRANRVPDVIVQSEESGAQVEPASQIMPSISPIELFGDFEEEEEISIGTRFTGRPNAATSKPKQDTTVEWIDEPTMSTEISNLPLADRAPKMPIVDLEEILHQEIIGIRQMADSMMADSMGQAMTESMELPLWPEMPLDPIGSDEASPSTDPELPTEGEPDEQVEDFIIASEQQSETTVSLSVALPEQESDSSANDIQLGRDDSDLLVIEDELELRRIDPAARRDSQNKTISVDFQAMLARMRSGSK